MSAGDTLYPLISFYAEAKVIGNWSCTYTNYPFKTTFNKKYSVFSVSIVTIYFLSKKHALNRLWNVISIKKVFWLKSDKIISNLWENTLDPKKESLSLYFIIFYFMQITFLIYKWQISITTSMHSNNDFIIYIP